MKKTIGILAHVDAGKTTLSEQVLFRAAAIRALGRVDHQSAFLDRHPLEMQRGITIFSDQAYFRRGEDEIFWVDTPGHIDFAAEMERVVDVMDYAVLVINGAEPVQSHTESIWTLLKAKNVPVILFINKTDREGVSVDGVLETLAKRLSPDIADMRGYAAGMASGGAVVSGTAADGMATTGAMPDSLIEAVAERDDVLLDALLEENFDFARWQEALVRQVAGRELFPVFSGSALQGENIDSFLDGLCALTRTAYDPSRPFAGRVYKVRHDPQGARLCFFKVEAGTVRVREEVALPSGETVKISELRRYHGAKYQPVSEAAAGDLIAAVGIPSIKPGEGLGALAGDRAGLRTFEPMMAVSLVWPKEVHPVKMLAAMRLLEDEEPSLAVAYNEKTASIDLHVMGEIQLEVLKQVVLDRFGWAIDFGPMRVLYMETVENSAIGYGHYEPLRHYAEVQLRLSPGPRGSGVSFESKCHVDTLALNWQRLIETHVFEKTHKGVLTGAPLTDVVVTLLSGRAHLKHTEGGDFRESTYRAIRNALMYAKSVLLEPVCRFTLSAPYESLGRVLGDLSRLHADCEPPKVDGDRFTLTGEAAFSVFAKYHADFLAATHGRGSLQYRFDHYAPAENAEAIIAEADYDPLADDTPDSVFCSHGAGVNVKWDEVRLHAHTPMVE